VNTERHPGHRLGNVAHDAADVERQEPAVRVAQHEAVGARLRGYAARFQRVGAIQPVAIEEMLGVEQYFEAGILQVADSLPDHGEVLAQRGTEDVPHVHAGSLAHHDCDWRARLHQGANVRVRRDGAAGSPRAAKGGQAGRA